MILSDGPERQDSARPSYEYNTHTLAGFIERFLTFIRRLWWGMVWSYAVWRPNTERRIDSSEVFFVFLWPRHCNFSNCEIENLNLYHEIQQKSTLPFLVVVVWFRILLLLHSQFRQLIWCIFCIKIFLKNLKFNWITVMWLVSSTIQLYLKSSTPWSIGNYQCIYWYP